MVPSGKELTRSRMAILNPFNSLSRSSALIFDEAQTITANAALARSRGGNRSSAKAPTILCIVAFTVESMPDSLSVAAGPHHSIGPAFGGVAALPLPNGAERWQWRRERAPKPYKRDSSGVAPASPQVAYRALLERCTGRPKKVGRIFGGPGSVIILRTISRSALTSAIRRFVSSPLSACAGALSGGLEAGLDVLAFCFRRFMLFTIR